MESAKTAPVRATCLRRVVLLGAVLWGASMVFQNSLAKAMVAYLVRPQDRSIAYGAFGLIYGTSWFAGSCAIGVLYDQHISAASATSVALEACGALLLLYFRVPQLITDTGENA